MEQRRFDLRLSVGIVKSQHFFKLVSGNTDKDYRDMFVSGAKYELKWKEKYRN